MVITLIILVLSAAFFMSGKVRSDLVALCALSSLLIFQILTPEEALQFGSYYDGRTVCGWWSYLSDRVGKND